MYHIYKIICNINNKAYIGKSTVPIKERWARHVRESYTILDTHLARAIRLYGPEAFTIEEIDNTEDYFELSQKEQYWIAKYNSRIEGFNETDGGEGGNTYIAKTPEEMEIIKEKIRQSKLGGKNPHAQGVKCKNILTNQEYYFTSLAEC